MEFMKRTPKKRPSKIEEMTKEQIRQAIVRKRECNAKSQYIVESLLERQISAEYLLRCLPDINQSHFDDIIEERSILHLCGYPICQNTLTVENIPKQKYRISMKSNKVYDITARKNFCSNTCYKSAMHVKKQMLTSPLWFREYEEIPTFNLLPLDIKGSLGLEVDVALVNRVTINTNNKSFTSINDFATASFNQMTKNDDTLVEIKGEQDKVNATEKESVKENFAKDKMPQNNHESHNQIANTNLNKENESQTLDTNHTHLLTRKTARETSKVLEEITSIKLEKCPNKKPVPNPLNIVGEIIEKPEKKIDPIILNGPEKLKKENTSNKESKKKILLKKQPVITVLTLEVEKCLAEWFTLDTLLFLFGEEKVKEMVADKGKVVKEYLSQYTNSIFYNSNAYDQYQALCRKLNMLELEERRHDVRILQKETKPLPDYKILQEESKNMQLKVKAFLSGETEIPEPETEEKNTEEDKESVTHLPLVDKKAQNALRRKIVWEQLNKILADLLRSLKLDNLSVSSDIRLLVNTFKLKPNNIMLKPIQWTLIAMVFIKLLSIRDIRLCYLLDTPTTYQNMQLLLLSYKQDGPYLNRLVAWLTHIDRLLDSHKADLSAV